MYKLLIVADDRGQRREQQYLRSQILNIIISTGQAGEIFKIYSDKIENIKNERKDVKLNIMKSFTKEISLQVLVIYEYSGINLDKFLLRTCNYRYSGVLMS